MNGVNSKRLMVTAILWLVIAMVVYALGMIILYVSAEPDRIFWPITCAYVVFGVLCGLLAGRWASILGILLASAAAYAILLFTQHDLVGWLAQGIPHGGEHADVIFFVSATRQSMSILLFLLAALLTAALVRWRHRQHT